MLNFYKFFRTADARDKHAKSGEECRDKKMYDVWREQRGCSIGIQDCILDLFKVVEESKEFCFPSDLGLQI